MPAKNREPPRNLGRDRVLVPEPHCWGQALEVRVRGDYGRCPLLEGQGEVRAVVNVVVELVRKLKRPLYGLPPQADVLGGVVLPEEVCRGLRGLGSPYPLLGCEHPVDPEWERPQHNGGCTRRPAPPPRPWTRRGCRGDPRPGRWQHVNVPDLPLQKWPPPRPRGPRTPRRLLDLTPSASGPPA